MMMKTVTITISQTTTKTIANNITNYEEAENQSKRREINGEKERMREGERSESRGRKSMTDK